MMNVSAGNHDLGSGKLMEKRCPSCGMVHSEDATVCPCGAALPAQESELRQFITAKVKALVLWLVIFFGIMASVFLLRHCAGVQNQADNGVWKIRNLKRARVSLKTPAPLEPVPIDDRSVPEAVRKATVAKDFYSLRSPGLDVGVARIVRKDSASDGSFIPALPASRGEEFDRKPKVNPCVAGNIHGVSARLHSEFKGRAYDSMRYVFYSGPEYWLVIVRWADGDGAARDAALRIADSIKIAGSPIQVLKSPEQSLTQSWRTYSLVPGRLSASSPNGWKPMDKDAVAMDSQLPCRPNDARYFYCQCGASSFVIGTGICSEDQSSSMKKAFDDAVHFPSTGSGPSKVARSIGILVGRRAVVRSRTYDAGSGKMVERRVLAADGVHAWLFEATYPAGDPDAAQLADRIQASIKGD